MKFIIIFSIVFFNLQSDMFSGKTNIENIQELDWFSEGYEAYAPDSNTIAQLKEIPGDITILAFGGTWCGDTHQLLPQFYKIMDEAGFPDERITLYLVDEDKNSPEGLEQKYNVEWIPTFIVLIDGEERGRIVESVEGSLEEEFVKTIF